MDDDLTGPMVSTAMRPMVIGGLDGSMHGAIDNDDIDHNVLLELGLAAMDELVKVPNIMAP